MYNSKIEKKNLIFMKYFFNQKKKKREINITQEFKNNKYEHEKYLYKHNLRKCYKW